LGTAQDKIQLLLTDMVLPDGMMGRELAEKLKARTEKLKVVINQRYSASVVGKGPTLVEGVNFLQKAISSAKTRANGAGLPESTRDWRIIVESEGQVIRVPDLSAYWGLVELAPPNLFHAAVSGPERSMDHLHLSSVTKLRSLWVKAGRSVP